MGAGIEYWCRSMWAVGFWSAVSLSAWPADCALDKRRRRAGRIKPSGAIEEKSDVLNQSFDVLPGNIVLRRMVRRTTRIAAFPEDILHKPDWVFSPKHRIAKGESIRVRELVDSDLVVATFGASGNPD